MQKNKKGFTLAELLTVVAVLAILVMISIPLISGRIEDAQAATCKTNRQALINGTTTATMTDKIDWNKEFPTGSKDVIITYLLEQGYITEATYCPSDGDIYVDAITKDTVYFKCTFHDDGVEPGEEGGSTTLDKSVEDLEEAVRIFKDGMENKVDSKINDRIMTEFINSEYAEKMNTINLSSVLTDEKINKIVDTLLKLKDSQWNNKDNKLFNSIKSLIDTETRLLPYYADKSDTIITYATSQPEYDAFMTSQGTKHRATSVICYKGSWYLFTNRIWSWDGIKPHAVFPALNSGSATIEAYLNNEILSNSQLNNIWFKLT